jgi:hypothetical protein
MEEILKSSLLEYDKSTFLIDLIEHKSGANYIKIKQTIEGIEQHQELKINPTVLTDLIFVLQSYQKDISKFGNDLNKSFFSDNKQKAIIERYLKGITILDLRLQFDCSEKIVEQILRNKGIEIVNNRSPENTDRFRFRRKNKN